jgi:hypothetical protein
MWQQLSRSEKRRVVLYGLLAPLEVAAAILAATAGQWFWFVFFAFWGVIVALRAVAIGSNNPRLQRWFLPSPQRRGSGQPPRTVNPGSHE